MPDQSPIPTRDVVSAGRGFLRDWASDRLSAAIFDGTLRPGERLRDADIASWLGVSRTPIREALARLVDSGLVEFTGNRIARVTTLTRKTISDRFDVWFDLVSEALRDGCTSIPSTDLPHLEQDLARAYAAPRGNAFVACAGGVLGPVMTASPNPVLLELIRRHQPLLRLAVRTHATHLDPLPITRGLTSVLRACEERDPGIIDQDWAPHGTLFFSGVLDALDQGER